MSEPERKKARTKNEPDALESPDDQQSIVALRNQHDAEVAKLRAELATERGLRMEAEAALGSGVLSGTLRVNTMQQEQQQSRQQRQSSIGEADKEADARKIEILSEKVCLLSGEAWATMQQLSSGKQSTEFSKDQPKHDCSESHFEWFRNFWPQDGNLPLEGKGELQRNSHRNYFKTDIFGNSPDPSEESHLCQHSPSCNRYWNPLLWYFAGNILEEYDSKIAKQQTQLRMFKNGHWESINSKKKRAHSSMNGAPGNHVMIRSQYLLDKKPKVMLSMKTYLKSLARCEMWGKWKSIPSVNSVLLILSNY